MSRCDYVYLAWSTESSACRVASSLVILSSGQQVIEVKKFYSSRYCEFTGITGSRFTVTVYVSRTYKVTRRDPSDYFSATTGLRGK